MKKLIIIAAGLLVIIGFASAQNPVSTHDNHSKQCVPEPMSIAALGIGALVVLSRKKKI